MFSICVYFFWSYIKYLLKIKPFLTFFKNLWINTTVRTSMSTPWISVSEELVRNFHPSTGECEELFLETRLYLPVTKVFDDKTCKRVWFLENYEPTMSLKTNYFIGSFPRFWLQSLKQSLAEHQVFRRTLNSCFSK